MNYGTPVLQLLPMLGKHHRRGVRNFREYRLSPEFYRRSRDSSSGMRALWEAQGRPEGIMLIPAQLGAEYQGYSAYLVREEGGKKTPKQFPLDASDGMQILLSHGERFGGQEDIALEFPGSECAIERRRVSRYSQGERNRFTFSLFLDYQDRAFELNCSYAYGGASSFGSATGYLFH